MLLKLAITFVCTLLFCGLPDLMKAEDVFPQNPHKKALTVFEPSSEKSDFFNSLSEKLTFSALTEVEAVFQQFRPKTGPNKSTSDFKLSKVELVLDAALNEYVQAHIKLHWEEDEVEPMDIDETYVTLRIPGDVSYYARLGKFNMSFGRYESAFITDQFTKIIGETKETCVELGLEVDWIILRFNAFDADIGKVGEADNINDFNAAVRFILPESCAGNFFAQADVSWTSNVGDSNNLRGEITKPLSRKVDGISASIYTGVTDGVFLVAEYTAALQKFRAGEFVFDNGQELKPSAWNIEIGSPFCQKWEAAINYQLTNDMGNFQPESSCGAVVYYHVFDCLRLGLEYLYADYDNKDKHHQVIAQISASI